MGITNFFKGFLGDVRNFSFISEMESLAKKSDSQTSVFTNVRRIDDVHISSYAIDGALEDHSPVWLLSDQGKIFLAKAAPAVNVEQKTIPPVAGDYIFICDYNIRRQDFRTEHFSYTRDAKTISDDIFAYFFEPTENILICSVNDDAVKGFKKILNQQN